MTERCDFFAIVAMKMYVQIIPSNLRENIVKNQGIAKSSGTKLISCRCVASSGSWKAVICQNLAKYSFITALLSLRKNLCRNFGTNADRQANALAVRSKSIYMKFCVLLKIIINSNSVDFTNLL